MDKKKLIWTNIALLIAVVVIVIIPFFVTSYTEFGGTDDKAGEIIMEIDNGYEPWFSSLIELPSDGVESLLFTVQAAIGALVLGFGLGYYKGRSKEKV